MESNNNDFHIIDSSQRHLAAQMFEPKRLVLARELNGIAKSTLAEQIECTPSAISQFESGLRPDPNTLYKIALALGVPVSFFTAPPKVKKIVSENCHYRSLRSTGIKERRRLQARGTLIHELVNWLDQKVEWQEEQVSGLSKVIKSNEDIELLANNIRRTWGLGLGPISNLLLLLENKGILITVIPSVSNKVDAFSTWSQNLPLIFLVDDKKSASRRRFDAAHEFGHLVMHADASPGDKDLEREANRFAGALLLPREAFSREFPKRINWDVLFDLKKRWKVSLQAILRRALDLELISDSTYKRGMIFMAQKGFRKEEPFESEIEQPKLLNRIVSYTQEEFGYSNEYFAKSLGINTMMLRDLLGTEF